MSEPHTCPDCGLSGVCPVGWVHTSIADRLLSALAAAERTASS